MKNRNILFMLLLLSTAFAFTLAPNAQDLDAVKGDVKTITYTITNDGNQTNAYVITTTGAASSWFTYDTTYLTIAQGQTGTFTATIIVPDTADVGTSSAVITATEDATSDAETATVNVNVKKWSYEDYAWLKQGEQLDINPLGYRLVLLETGDSYIRYDLYRGSTKEKSEALLSTNAYITEDNLQITLEDVSGTGQEVRLKIQTTDPATTMSVSDSGEVGANGKLEPVISKYIFSLEQGKTESLTVTVRNLFNDKVEVKDITLFPIGSDLFQINQAEMKNLQPNEDLSIGMKIDSTGVTPDTYTANLQVVGFYRNQKVQATIPFEVTVTQSKNPTAVSGGMVATLPAEGYVGNATELKVQPVMQGDTLFVEPKEGMDTTSEATMTGDVLKKKLTFSKTGMYSVTAYLMRGGTVLTTFQKTITINEPPKPPRDKNMQIYTTPSNPEVGDTIQVNVRDADSGDLVKGVNILVNGAAVSQGSSITLEKGKQYAIEAFADGYAKTSKTFDYRNKAAPTPTPAPSITASPSVQNVQAGEDVTMSLSQSTKWEVKDAQTGKVVASDDGKIVSLKPMTGGILYVYAMNKKVGTIRVADTQKTPWELVLGSLAFAAIIGGAFLYKKRKGSGAFKQTAVPMMVEGGEELPPAISEVDYTE